MWSGWLSGQLVKRLTQSTSRSTILLGSVFIGAAVGIYGAWPKRTSGTAQLINFEQSLKKIASPPYTHTDIATLLDQTPKLGLFLTYDPWRYVSLATPCTASWNNMASVWEEADIFVVVQNSKNGNYSIRTPYAGWDQKTLAVQWKLRDNLENTNKINIQKTDGAPLKPAWFTWRLNGKPTGRRMLCIAPNLITVTQAASKKFETEHIGAPSGYAFDNCWAHGEQLVALAHKIQGDQSTIFSFDVPSNQKDFTGKPTVSFPLPLAPQTDMVPLYTEEAPDRMHLAFKEKAREGLFRVLEVTREKIEINKILFKLPNNNSIIKLCNNQLLICQERDSSVLHTAHYKPAQSTGSVEHEGEILVQPLSYTKLNLSSTGETTFHKLSTSCDNRYLSWITQAGGLQIVEPYKAISVRILETITMPGKKITDFSWFSMPSSKNENMHFLRIAVILEDDTPERNTTLKILEIPERPQESS